LAATAATKTTRGAPLTAAACDIWLVLTLFYVRL